MSGRLVLIYEGERVVWRCAMCAFETSRPVADYRHRGRVLPRATEMPCSSCSTDLDAYDAGDGNEPAIVTEHSRIRIEP